MPAYRFSAIDADGRAASGLLDADSPRLVRQHLRERGLIALTVEPVTSLETGRGRALSAARVSLMLGQLASILRAGVPLARALEVCLEASDEPRTRQALAALKADVLAGFALSDAMARQPRLFDAFCVAVVRAGEKSGLIDQVIERLALFLERRATLSQKIRLALVYPALLCAVSLAIILALLQFVIPQVASVFAHNKQALPLVTRVLLGAADFLKSTGLVVLPTLAVAGWGLTKWLRGSAPGRARAERAVLALPAIGRILRDGDIARTTSTLALLAGSGVPLTAALTAAREVASLASTKSAMAQVSEAVEEGSPLARALAQTGAFPPLLVLLATSGEESGRLPAMLDEAASRLDEAVRLRVDTVVRLFEPAVVLVMGAMVLFIVLAVLLPIFEMNQLVK